MALDGQPSEPFLARNGALVLAPGSRVDAFIDATAPPGSTSPILLHDGKEARPIARLVTSSEPPIRAAPLPAGPAAALQRPAGAARPQGRASGSSGAGRRRRPIGSTPANFAATAAARLPRQDRPHRRAGPDQPRRASPTVFHLHGHHFRLLDRLDDGWKPFWLDTLAVEPGQTQRIAFAAEYAGRWLIEADRDRLDCAAPCAMVQCRMRKPDMSATTPAIRSVRARAVVAPISAAGEKRLRRHRGSAAGADRCRDRPGRYRPILHLRLQPS